MFSLCRRRVMTGVTALQQLQASTNGSDPESQPQCGRGTTQSLFAVFERHAVCYVGETRGYFRHVAGPYEECDEELSDMTTAIDLVALLHLYSAVRLQCFPTPRPPVPLVAN